jgi:protocatechuate 3,4-dioxygenase alpha subunit
MSLRMTGSQTVGPFFRIGLSHLYRQALVADAPLRVRGRVFDGDGTPIPDAILELWQADTRGRYAATPEATAAPADFMGFARIATEADGGFEFRTHKPGRVPGRAGVLQAPHISLHVFMRGLLKPVHTRLYFPDEASNAEDEVLTSVPQARRATLIARSSAPNLLEWDIHMQGERETVFFSY